MSNRGRSRFGGDEVIIRSMLVQQTGTFHNVYNRSFEMNLDDHSLRNIIERVNGVGINNRIHKNAFRGMAASVLAPNAEVDTRRDLIDIPDGWGAPRCRFIMEVEVNGHLGNHDVYFVQGFSDHLGLSRSGKIDTKMRWFINGFIKVQYSERQTRRGTQRVGIVKCSAQVINGRLIYDRDTEVEMTRTVDLFGNMQSRYLEEGHADNVIDDRTTLNSPTDSIFAMRRDNLPGEYLGSTLSAYRRNLDILQFGVGREDILARTQQDLNSDLRTMADNSFLRQLATVQGQITTTDFTIDDLALLDPDVLRPGVIQGGELDGRAMAQLAHNEGDVSDWRGADLESRMALQLSNGLSAIMMANYHRSFHAEISNLNLDHQTVVNPIDSEPIAEGMPVEMFDRMINDIQDLMFDLTAGERDDFFITVKANLYDQTEIFVSINGSRRQRYFVPSFADALMSPFYSRDRNSLSNLSQDIERLISDISGELSGSATAVATGV